MTRTASESIREVQLSRADTALHSNAKAGEYSDDQELADLRRSIELARAGCEFWRDRLSHVDVAAETAHDLLAQVPILERDEIQTLSQFSQSELHCVDPSDFTRFHHTSGSTGSGALWVFDTRSDWRAITDAWASALDLYGIGSGDRVLVCAGYGRFIGFWGLHDALVERGCMTVSGADLDTVGRAELVRRLGITVIAATPTYAQVLGQEIASDTHEVRLVITSGEPRPPATRQRIMRLWRSATRDTAGMSEVGTITMAESVSRPDDLLILRGTAYEEVLDRNTREPVQDGALGVRVITTLRREGMPFIRYWSGDLVRRVPSDVHEAGATHLYEGGILGRTDDMVKVRGVWFRPAMLEQALLQFDEIIEFQSRVETDVRGLRQLKVEIETPADMVVEQANAFLKLVADECKRELGFRPVISRAEHGSLPRYETKARRFRGVLERQQADS